MNHYDKSTPIYIDSDLKEKIPGEVFAKFLYDQRFRNLYLATGYDRSEFGHMPWIKNVSLYNWINNPVWIKTHRMTKYIGAHVSTEGGLFNAAKNAFDINAKAFALFLKNQRQWEAKPLDNTTISKFKESITTYGFKPEYILPHAGYLINLGNPNSENRKKSVKSFIEEMSRCSRLGLKYLNIHPGSYLNEISEDECINLIADSIEQAIDAVKGIKIVIENTAGQGSNMGYKFEHLAEIIKKVKDKSRIGVCLDTCHTFAAGYDIKNPKRYKETMEKFEDVVGLKYLTAVHLNDSKVPLASRKDRHENIGRGFLGLDFFKRFMNDLRFDNMPIILETIDVTLWKDEIALLYSYGD